MQRKRVSGIPGKPWVPFAMRPGRLKGIVPGRAKKEKGLQPKRQQRQRDRPGKVGSRYEPIKKSGLFEKLVYFGRRRSVSYWSLTSTNFLLAVTVVMGRWL